MEYPKLIVYNIYLPKLVCTKVRFQMENDVILGCARSRKLVSLEILDASKKGLLNVFVELA